MKTLVTGFTPFDGRPVNASWIAACSLSGETALQTLEIPVEWGTPARLLTPLCRRDCPDAIISMGEGREGWFDIETVARNVRKERPDNQGVEPGGALIDPDGPASIRATVDAAGLQRMLVAAGFPVRTSSDAGAYLCEETLYTIERLRAEHERLTTVVFVHLPPYGTPLNVGGKEIRCDEMLLTRFARKLHTSVLAVHTNSAGGVEETDSFAGEIVHNALLKN